MGADADADIEAQFEQELQELRELDARGQLVPGCRSEGCRYLAHPSPEEHDIQPGYCCNLCYGRSSGQEWASARRKGKKNHYENCRKEIINNEGASSATPVVGEISSKARFCSSFASAARASAARPAPAPAHQERQKPTEIPQREAVAVEAGAPDCPQCKQPMAWDAFAEGPDYALGWICSHRCGEKSVRTNGLVRARWFCAECKEDVCGACGSGFRTAAGVAKPRRVVETVEIRDSDAGHDDRSRSRTPSWPRGPDAPPRPPTPPRPVQPQPKRRPGPEH